jgi:hypothetical protein
MGTLFDKHNAADHSGRSVQDVYGLEPYTYVIVGSNAARDKDECPRFSVLCCPVSVQALEMG